MNPKPIYAARPLAGESQPSKWVCLGPASPAAVLNPSMAGDGSQELEEDPAEEPLDDSATADDASESEGEYVALLTTLQDEPEEETEGPKSRPEFSDFPSLSDDHDTDEGDDSAEPGITDEAALQIAMPVVLLEGTQTEGDDHDGPVGLFQFELDPINDDEPEDDSEGVSDFVALEALPDLDSDESQDKTELDVGSASFSEDFPVASEQVRFSLLSSVDGAFSAVCLTAQGVVVAQTLREDQSRLCLVDPGQAAPLKPLASSPGKVLSLAYTAEHLFMVSHTRRCLVTHFDEQGTLEWRALALPPPLADRREVQAECLYQDQDQCWLELNDGRFVELSSVGSAPSLSPAPPLGPSRSRVSAALFASWCAEIDAGVLWLSHGGLRQKSIAVSAPTGVCLGRLDGAVHAWVTVDDFSADQSRVLEIDVQQCSPISVATIPRLAGSEELVVEQALWSAESRTLFIATDNGLFVLQRLEA